MREYDYIVAGAGASGLSLIMHLIRSGKFDDKNILLVDNQEKVRNDRTWCFWEESPGIFESIIYKSWKFLDIYSLKGQHIHQAIDPYTYKLIRGIDYYNYCLSTIRSCSNITVLNGRVSSLKNENRKAVAVINGETFSAQYIFNSILFQQPKAAGSTYLLQQHFKGWVIESSRDVFNSTSATLMDFRVSQEPGTAFVYLMPFSTTKALVEYTVFSAQTLPEKNYDLALKCYCNNRLLLDDGEYNVLESETGVIPMTNFPFSIADGNVVNIGTAGGQTKGSSGYTFSFIHKQSAAIVKSLTEGKFPGVAHFSMRHQFYDSVLLNILSRKKMEGAAIFSQLFQRNQISQVLKFLNNETSVAEDLAIISKLPTLTFLNAAINHLGR